MGDVPARVLCKTEPVADDFAQPRPCWVGCELVKAPDIAGEIVDESGDLSAETRRHPLRETQHPNSFRHRRKKHRTDRAQGSRLPSHHIRGAQVRPPRSRFAQTKVRRRGIRLPESSFGPLRQAKPHGSSRRVEMDRRQRAGLNRRASAQARRESPTSPREPVVRLGEQAAELAPEAAKPQCRQRLRGAAASVRASVVSVTR
jgi:hypothetical protein